MVTYSDRFRIPPGGFHFGTASTLHNIVFAVISRTSHSRARVVPGFAPGGSTAALHSWVSYLGVPTCRLREYTRTIEFCIHTWDRSQSYDL